ncbi:synaptotagmin-5-like [Canna indica]|uniref:Synaptotagmin-5-like n=1 Tax=Canna indica TaxID=4628 RepID=A0AAQ3L6D5_9LILI|nr:synaptotagmin-5-like [Canna indica]
MGFFLGLVLGVIVGVGLVMAFARSENARSKRRGELAATVAAFSRMTVEDSRKLLPAEFYPSWVVFSQRQKFGYHFLLTDLFVNWLNAELTKIWPYVNQAASELIRSSVEPVLEQYKSVILSSLKFSKLTLGTVAPQITGISIIEDDKSGITMEFEMQWDGNPSIILDIRTRLGVSLPIQVKNIGFTGVFRLIFKPLVDEFPCFGAVSFSLREKKKLDFTLKVVGGDLSSLPGISDAIEGTIRDAIEDSITWPVRKVIPILPGDYSDLELKPTGILEVKLVQAKDLTNKDIIGKSDPYSELYIRPLRDRIKTSKVINNDLNPIWNEHFEFIVEDASTQHLTVKIYDDEGLQPSEFIGCAQVSLKDLQPGKVKDIWLKLVKDLEIQRDRKDRGQVILKIIINSLLFLIFPSLLIILTLLSSVPFLNHYVIIHSQ